MDIQFKSFQRFWGAICAKKHHVKHAYYCPGRTVWEMGGCSEAAQSGFQATEKLLYLLGALTWTRTRDLSQMVLMFCACQASVLFVLLTGVG